MNNRTILGLLYVLLFAGFTLMSVFLRILHWISDNFGLYAVLGCLIGYAATMAGLVWAAKKVGQSVPTLRLPPSGTLPPSAYEIRETTSYDEQSLKLDKAERSNLPCAALERARFAPRPDEGDPGCGKCIHSRQPA